VTKGLAPIRMVRLATWRWLLPWVGLITLSSTIAYAMQIAVAQPAGPGHRNADRHIPKRLNRADHHLILRAPDSSQLASAVRHS
jgi:hypothetical protein